MKLLLDASIIVPLLLDYGEKLLDIATRIPLHITDLTIYEAGNSLWKLSTLRKTVSLEDAVEIIGVLKDLVRKEVIGIVRFDELDLRRIVELATAEKTTFYDTSYVVAAEALGAALVTEDRELKEKAKKYVDVITYNRLRQRHLR